MALSRREDGAALLLKINYQDEDRGRGGWEGRGTKLLVEHRACGEDDEAKDNDDEEEEEEDEDWRRKKENREDRGQ